MGTRTVQAAAVLAITLLLTGCSTGGDASDKSTPTGTPAAAEKARVTRACVDAIADRAAAHKGGAVRSHPVPAPCARLSDADYLDAYMKGLEQAHRAAKKTSQGETGKAAEGGES
ncbi:hypothetical protein [Streptomyces rapamycinicus]|uniref:Lipoprotein n=2 Tax=Streptomyces rapamycinicus TaxID=1226757 RepID=A0A0A0NDN8_STRRN|nr:hypothetical protein [Streptomyces rapamycinicus]AGP52540.1 hypothetical protein M271_04555 [Streptomyces rapamycinicus NRRL 5491]MBB4780009.1 hypothetical protein [Streptomyces rapamycinicus]RLV75336.1 hypothetical protein D3C57_138960 [Streptomyces rapamycinicus NRRL 5491]UTP28716.1 hypothetical protein LIV37_04695 [Streptomyces rapamycinicus NRRL 5491]